MASGHVNRTNRPNTWLHRPAMRREDSPCQLGAVHTWHLADLALRPDFDELGVSGLASMYPTFDWSAVLRAIMDISARAISLTDRPQRAI